VLVNTDFFPEYGYGQQIEVIGEISLPKNSASSSFDFAAYLAKDDIFTVMYMPQIRGTDAGLSFFEKNKIRFLQEIFWVKGAFERSINRSIAEPNAAFINGILLGRPLPDPGWPEKCFHCDRYHPYSGDLRFQYHHRGRPGRFIFSFIFQKADSFLVFHCRYCFVHDFDRRPGIGCKSGNYGLPAAVGEQNRRQYGARNAIVFAGAAMILINPDILQNDVGFQLSFMATLGLIYLSPYFTGKFEKITDFFNLRENLAMTVSAQIAVLPLLLFYFKQISIVSLPANILVLPLVPVQYGAGFYFRTDRNDLAFSGCPDRLFRLVFNFHSNLFDQIFRRTVMGGVIRLIFRGTL